MPKQPTAHPGPSAHRGKPVKVIQKTNEMLQKVGKGKAKENAVFGDLNRLVAGELICA
jgi:hypothetical protein